MNSKRMVSLVLAASASFFAAPASAGDWRCNQSGGCTASYCCDENGELRVVQMPKDSVVATEAGWVVNSSGGWRPISG